jgi:two-component system response regulator BaeR
MMEPASMNAARILIAEDEARIASVLADYLRASALQARIVERGDLVIEQIQQWQPQLLLLDLNLPVIDGLTLCRKIRSDSSLPIIMVTARVDEVDRLLGLELGADDYICKPFSPREVVARVQAVLRRSSPGPASSARTLWLDRDGRSATLLGQPLNLTEIEYRLLALMSNRPGRVWSRAQLLDQAYSDYREVSDRAIDSHIKNLRRKLETAAPQTRWIHSVYGVGYRFEAEAMGELHAH